MHDRCDRTSWAYQVPPNITPPTHYTESFDIPECHPNSSSHMLSTSITHTLLPSWQHHQRSSHRFLTSSAHSVNILESCRCSSNNDCTNEENCVQQYHQEHPPHPLTSLPQSFNRMTETWFGLVQTPRDAYMLLEACRVGMLYRITRRLTDLERSQTIRPGAVFVWEEKEAGIKRWTDHVRWSPSRVSGAFLIYSELLPVSSREPYVRPGDPLLKQSFSSTTLKGERLHLIAYYSKSSMDSGQLLTPSIDDRLRSIVVPIGIYPDHRATMIDDQSYRDRQRSLLLPRSSVGSSETSCSAPSTNSIDSAVLPLDTPQFHPVTSANLIEDSCHRPSLSGTSHHHPTRSLPGATGSNRFASSQRVYDGSPLFPFVSRLPDSQASSSEPSRWDTLPSNMSSWESDRTNPVASKEAVSAFTSPILPNVTSMGVWKGKQEGENVEKRSSAPTTHSVTTPASRMTSSGSLNYHPYARFPDRELAPKDRRTDTRHKDTSPGFSFGSSTAPGTPSTRIYTLPSQHPQSNDGVLTSYLPEFSKPTAHSPLEDERICKRPVGQSSTHIPSQKTYPVVNSQFRSSQTPPEMCISQEEPKTFPQPSPNDNSSFMFFKTSSDRFSPSTTNKPFEADSNDSPVRNLGESFENPRHYSNPRPPSITSDENSMSNLLSSNPEPGGDDCAKFFIEHESEEPY